MTKKNVSKKAKIPVQPRKKPAPQPQPKKLSEIPFKDIVEGMHVRIITLDMPGVVIRTDPSAGSAYGVTGTVYIDWEDKLLLQGCVYGMADNMEVIDPAAPVKRAPLLKGTF